MISKGLLAATYHGKLQELSGMGVQLTLVHPPKWGSQKPEPGPISGYEVKVLPCVFTGHNHFHFYVGLGKVINGTPWDVVHIDEEPYSLVTYQAMSSCVSRKIPTILAPSQNIYKRYPAPFSLVERYNLAHASGIIAVNSEALEVVRRKGFTHSGWVAPQFGVDPSLFCKQDRSELRRELGLERHFVIGCVGRVIEEKGLDTVLDSLALLPSDCVLAVVGSGPQRDELEEQARRLKLSNRVRWLSAVRSMEVPRFLNIFDVLVLASKTRSYWKEQFGRILAEAMACEIPVVGSDSGEIPRTLGEGGLVFPEGDANALAACLLRLMRYAELRARLGACGRERVLKYFTNTQLALITLEAYKAAVSGA
jgi:glycosyltransferase involved in cell wall biosynthesis